MIGIGLLFSAITCYRVHSWVSQSGKKVRTTWGWEQSMNARLAV